MPFTKRGPLRVKVGGLSRAQMIAGIVWGERAARFCARWGVPSALAFVMLSGPLLSRIGGGLAPYPGLRSLHALAGLALVLAVLYEVGAAVVCWGESLWNRVRHRIRIPRSNREPFAFAISSLHGVLLVMVLWTGIERYIGQRWGTTVLPILSPIEWGLAHRLIAPYYLSALLIHWFMKSRVAWRSLLDQLRKP
jgi:hypothetical protein